MTQLHQPSIYPRITGATNCWAVREQGTRSNLSEARLDLLNTRHFLNNVPVG